MSSIDKINVTQPNTVLKPPKTEQTNQKELGDGFEEQLLNTVQKLESLENEIDELIEKNSDVNATSVSDSVQSVGKYIQSMAGVVEDLSSEKSKAQQKQPYGIQQYTKLNSAKEA